MIEITDEMVAAFSDAEAMDPARTRDGLAAVLTIVERDFQKPLVQAYQRGWQQGQHHLCPRCGVELAQEVAQEEKHRYLSTGCLHGEHDYCRSMTGYQGEKRPAQCKFCDARCVCPCHADGAS